MPDRVSVGSPGGAGGNEIEAILRSVYTDEEGTVSSRQHVNDAIRECLQILARRSPQGEDHEAGIEAALDDFLPRYVHRWEHIPNQADHRRYWRAEFERLVPFLVAPSPVSGTEPDTASPCAIAAWVREQADDKDYGVACEWRNVADAIEREGESSDWRCECGDLNRDHEAFCYRCGAGQPESTEPDTATLRDLAEAAVFACLPLLPLNGSDGSGYRVSKRIDPTLRALPEEWAEAAHAIAALHTGLAGFSVDAGKTLDGND